MIVINKRQARALIADLEGEPDLPEHQFVELHQFTGRRTIELRVPNTANQVSGDFLFPDGTTGY